MAIERRGILAVPGEYKFGDNIEIKTDEELRKAAQRQHEIMLTYGHPADPRWLNDSDFIGVVEQEWNPVTRRIEGKFKFYDERVPDEVRVKLENREPLRLSAGYTVGEVDGGIQKGILYNHIAILKDDDIAKCPLGKCGVDIRMESDSQIRYEQASELPDPEAKETQQKEEPKPIEVTGFNEVQLGQIRDLISELVPAPPQAEPEPVVEEKPEPEATPEPTPPEPKVEPVATIPAERDDTPVSGSLKEGIGIQILGEEIK